MNNSPTTRAVVYAECISAEGYDILNKCPGYDTKPSDGDVSVVKLWGNVDYFFISIIPSPTLTLYLLWFHLWVK